VALARLAESRDDDTGAHIERVQALCRLVGEALMGRNPEVDARLVDLVAHASPLHDIGKVGIPDAVLLKPGRLTPDEFRVIQAHTTLGARTLEAVHLVYPRNAFLRVGLDVARSHHERWDGGGYPEGRRGADIPIAARIVAVADVYDALRSRRPYKEPWSHERALATILSDAGRQFDPAVARAFESVEVRCAEARERLGD
jgi:putative two-component system response regulator